MRTRSVAVVTLLALIVAACGGENAPTTTQPMNPTPPPDVTVLKANLPRVANPDVSGDVIDALVSGNTTFAFEVFRRAAADGDNVVLSPYSIGSALTMAYAGARGVTGEEIRRALALVLPDDQVHAARNALDQLIATTPPPQEDDERQPFTIRVANSLWGQTGYPFLDEYLELLAANYDAGMNLVDFINAAEQARLDINTWVEDTTEGRIKDLIPQGAIDELTRLVLVNAIWFKANWANQFDPDMTSDGAFTLLDGTKTSVPMVRGNQTTAYARTDGYQALNLPYAGDASMILVLPDSGRFDEVSSTFGPEDLNQLRQGMEGHSVEIAFPKFEFTTHLPMKGVLSDMGIEAAFKDPNVPDGADFTGITPERELLISDVVHQAFIKVDEEGTEAAAATAIIFSITSMPPPATFEADRPFLFFIVHNTTGEILFLGQVTDPR